MTNPRKETQESGFALFPTFEDNFNLQSTMEQFSSRDGSRHIPGLEDELLETSKQLMKNESRLK